MLSMEAVKTVNPKTFNHKKKFFSISCISNLYEMMDAHWTDCDNHFVMYVNQIIMLCTFNLAILNVSHTLIKQKEKNMFLHFSGEKSRPF